MNALYIIGIICLIIIFLIRRKGLIEARKDGRDQDNTMKDMKKRYISPNKDKL
jgi:hypothetical protein